MSALLIWMNTEEAKLFHIEPESIHVEKVIFHGPKHHDETLGRNHTIQESDEQRFYSQLSEKLKTALAKKWILMGPSLGVRHFAAYLEKSHPEQYQCVIGVEKVDKMPDSEILSVGRAYLQKYYLFHSA